MDVLSPCDVFPFGAGARRCVLVADASQTPAQAAFHQQGGSMYVVHQESMFF
jgi:hypothetical protein